MVIRNTYFFHHNDEKWLAFFLPRIFGIIIWDKVFQNFLGSLSVDCQILNSIVIDICRLVETPRIVDSVRMLIRWDYWVAHFLTRQLLTLISLDSLIVADLFIIHESHHFVCNLVVLYTQSFILSYQVLNLLVCHRMSFFLTLFSNQNLWFFIL